MESIIGLILLIFVWRVLVHAKREFHWFEPKYPERTPQAIWEWGQSQWQLSKTLSHLPTQLAARKREIEFEMNQRLARLGYRGEFTLDGPPPEIVKPPVRDQWEWMKRNR